MKNIIIKILIIIVIIVLGVLVGIRLTDSKGKKMDNINSEGNNVLSQEEVKPDENNEVSEQEIKEEDIADVYFWQNPSEEIKEEIITGIQGGELTIYDDNTITLYNGNGMWCKGDYSIEGTNVICNIDTFDSEWNKEPENLERSITVKFKYDKDNKTLEIISISSLVLTAHIVDMTTGELQEETKQFSLPQLENGNIYSTENIYNLG